MTAVQYRPATDAERASPAYRRDVLAAKLRLWEARRTYAVSDGNTRWLAECERAISDLNTKIATVSA